MRTKKTAYILYTYSEFNNDYEQVFEYYSIKDLADANPELVGDNIRSLYHGISKDLESVNYLIKDKYTIIKEQLDEDEEDESIKDLLDAPVESWDINEHQELTINID